MKIEQYEFAPLSPHTVAVKGGIIMKKTYDIMLGNNAVGSAQVSKEGLYYRFRCRCDLSGDVMYQLKTVCEDKEYSLGILVPVEDYFCIETKVPIKKIGETDISFFIAPRHASVRGNFIPIRAEEPFSYIEKLEDSYLEVQNNELGVRIVENDNQLEI